MPKSAQKTYSQLFWEYLNKSNIHGYKYLGERSWMYLERFIWLVFIIILLALTAFLVINSYIQFLDAPTATTQMPTKKYISEIPFPAAAICSGNRISKKRITSLAETLYDDRNRSSVSIGETVEQMANSLLVVGAMYDYELTAEQTTTFIQVHRFLEEYYGTPAYPLRGILTNITPACDEIIEKCRWKGVAINCKNLFFLRKTFMGSCCLFNYQRITSLQFSAFQANRTAVPKTQPLYLNGPGVPMGLSILINHKVDDYAYSVFSCISAKLLIFDPMDFPDSMSGSLNEIFLDPHKEIFAPILPIRQRGSKEMRDVPSSSRGCVFDDEINLLFKNFYTHSECNFVCRMNDMMSACNCYSQNANIAFNSTACILDDLPCLMKWKESWINKEPLLESLNKYKGAGNCPECMPTCDYIKYKIQTSWAEMNYSVIQNRSFWPELVKNITHGNYTILHLYFGTSYIAESLQTIVGTWYDLLSNFGGICGLVIGASLISVIELVYFCTGKFFTFCIAKREEGRKTPTGTELYWSEITIYSK